MRVLGLAAGACACAAAAALYVHGPFGARKLEDEIDRAVSQALAIAGRSWARAEIDGQRVTLTGAAPSLGEMEAAAREIRAALGPGGPLFGAVASVDAGQVEIVPSPTPRSLFRLRIIKRGGIFSAFGASAGEPMEATLREALGAAAGDIAAGLERDAFEDAADWTPAIGGAAHALALLDEGTLSIDGGALSLTGSAASPQVADLARGFLAAASPFFEATVAISAGPALAEREISLAACAERAAAADSSAPISFASQSSRLSADARAAINRLAAALQPCAAFGVLIEAHADQTGGRAANRALTRRRAEAVAAALKDAGLLAAIEARGQGEDAPLVAIERSDADRAANRRVEISVFEPGAAAESE